MTVLARRVACSVLALAAGVADAADFRSIGNDPAILYDAPTARGTRLFAAPPGMPVDVVVDQGEWVRVRDASGGFAWVERKALVERRTVVARATGTPVDVRASPDAGAPVSFRVQANVLLEMTAPPAGGWVAVRHRDGAAGYVRASDVWGT